MSPTSPLRAVLVGEAATEALGRRLGAALRRGDLLALDGDLGAGKTTLVRGLAAGLGADPAEVRSPTYVLHHVHRGGLAVLHHIDLYRLGAAADTGLDDLDLEALLDEGVVAVEWAELAPGLEVRRPIRLRLDAPSPDRRIATLDGSAPARLLACLGDREAGTAP